MVKSIESFNIDFRHIIQLVSNKTWILQWAKTDHRFEIWHTSNKISSNFKVTGKQNKSISIPLEMHISKCFIFFANEWETNENGINW